MPPLDRDRLLRATEDLLGRGGLAAVNASAIAQEAGVSRVTLHRNEITATTLVVELVERAAADLRSSLWSAMTLTAPAAERLRESLRVLCVVVERHEAVLAALFDRPDEVEGSDRAPSFEFIEPFEQLLTDGATDGSLLATDPAGDAMLLVNAVTWTYLHMRRSHDWSVADAAERTIGLCSAGFVSTDDGRGFATK